MNSRAFLVFQGPLAKQLPLWDGWGEGIRGFGLGSLAAIIGEAGAISNYATVSKLWKRLGLAVIGGERQRKKTDKEAAIEHGYNPSRRSVMWNVGQSLFKAQSQRMDKETEEVLRAAGPYRVVYDTYKAEREATMVEVCSGCKGEGKTKGEDGKRVKCRNCGGSGGPAPWGMSPRHRHNAATRYMEKRFVRDLWRAWRDCG